MKKSIIIASFILTTCFLFGCGTKSSFKIYGEELISEVIAGHSNKETPVTLSLILYSNRAIETSDSSKNITVTLSGGTADINIKTVCSDEKDKIGEYYSFSILLELSNLNFSGDRIEISDISITADGETQTVKPLKMAVINCDSYETDPDISVGVQRLTLDIPNSYDFYSVSPVKRETGKDKTIVVKKIILSNTDFIISKFVTPNVIQGTESFEEYELQGDDQDIEIHFDGSAFSNPYMTYVTSTIVMYEIEGKTYYYFTNQRTYYNLATKDEESYLKSVGALK